MLYWALVFLVVAIIAGALGFGGIAGERGALDDILDFTSCLVPLALDDLAREDDVFEINDGEVVIFKFVRCVG